MTTARAAVLGLGIALLATACAKGGTGSGGTAGTSGSSCIAGQTPCGDKCVDVTADPMNCGGCGIPCSTGQTCQGGTCLCQSGMLCNGTCVSSDASHCGSCATTCAAGQVCSNNACTSSCSGGQTLCGTACVVTNGADVLNCGACGMSCAAGQVCNGGACGCATGQTMCGGSCVDTTSSGASCGSCGHACGSTQHCAVGACVDNSTTGAGGTTGAAGTTGKGGTPGAGGAATGAAGTTGSTGSAGTTGTGGTVAAQSSLVTSASGAFWKTGTLTTVTSGNATVTVTDSSTAQTWEGFGGAFNELGWSYLSMLSQSDRDNALHLLYGSDGARFNIGRVPIGANDYAVGRYTDDEVATGSTDYSMASFTLTEDTKYLIPYIKAAQALNGGIRFWGSPWTPPTWMKTSSGTVNGTACTYSGTAFDSGCMMDNAQVLTAYAQYFVKWVQGYAAQGITIESVGPQNEPNYFDNYPSCGWSPALFTKFIGQYLGPAFTTANLATKIMLGTMSNADSGKDPSIVSAVLADATAKSYTKLFGYQWNMEPNVAAAKSSNLPIWQTEHKCGNYPWGPAGFPAFNPNMAPNDYAYGVESWGNIRDWIKAGVTAYNAWNTVLDTAGKNIDSKQPWPQNALLTVNTSTKALTITPAYYVFRHCSQFVSPGAKVVASSGGDALAFKNLDGSIVTIMYNAGAATTYTLAVGGKKLQFSMPANGWATVDYVP
jgi:glucosylceramidase